MHEHWLESRCLQCAEHALNVATLNAACQAMKDCHDVPRALEAEIEVDKITIIELYSLSESVDSFRSVNLAGKNCLQMRVA